MDCLVHMCLSGTNTVNQCKYYKNNYEIISNSHCFLVPLPQTLHKLPQRAMEWLLKFIGTLLVFLGKFALPIQRIAASFPGTLYLRGRYLDEKVSRPSIVKYVVCSSCHALHSMPKSRTTIPAQSKVCNKCSARQPLFKKVVTGSKSIRFYPRLLFPVCSLISSLQVLLACPGFAELCEEWRIGHVTNSDQLNDVFDGNIWNDFVDERGRPFFSEHFTIGLMLNVDWFNPFVYNTYSCGVMFLSIMNLPRAIRYKRENIILLGLIPGPKEPSLSINSYLQPLVKELLVLWKGVRFQTSQQGSKLYRCALYCVACDTPAARKIAGFLGHSADLGCLKCYQSFGTGQFGQMNYSGFDRSLWKPRTEKQHRKDVQDIQRAHCKTKQRELESEHGCRYSYLLELPYFDPIRMVIIDPMHNLYLGTAKRVFNYWVQNDILDKKAITVINSRIASMCIPPGATMSRLPSTIGSSAFTAEQWMVWVNYYSISCLYQLLPSSHMECWRHFVLASRLISSYVISKEEIMIADALLLQFCKRFQTICGQQSITPNMHLHCHLHDCIKNFGPVSAFWLFPYERYNGVLGDEPTNNHSIELQLINRFIEDNCYLRLLHNIPDSSVCDFFCSVVANHAFQFGSVKATSSYDNQKTTSGISFILPRKYTLEHLSTTELINVHELYLKLYPALLQLPPCTASPFNF